MYFDLQIFNFLNDVAGRFELLDSLGIFLANYLPYLLGVLLLVLLFWPKGNVAKNRAMVLTAVISGVIARFLLKSVILLFYGRPRPYVVFPSAQKLIPTIVSDNFQSFPSGHAIFFFAASTVIYKCNKKLGIYFFISSLVMGIARVFIGVHWPSDIIGGLVLGVLAGLIIHWIYMANRNVMDGFIARMFKGIDKIYNRF